MYQYDLDNSTKDGTNNKMPKYKLTYFNFRARAELPRLVFAVADVEYEDIRIQSANQWLTLKPSTPFGQLPMLEVDGDQICQSNTISRYLAKEYGLIGKSSLEEAKADMIVGCVDDMLEPIQPCYREQSVEKKNKMRREYDLVLPDFMKRLEKMLVSNDGGDGYFVGDQLTWSDLAVMNAWHWIPGFGVFPPIHDYPKLNAHRQRVEDHPRIADWLDRRPETPV